MGEVKRFMIGGHWDDKPLKECVLASDYDALRAENAELVAALIDAQKIINYHGWSTNEQPAYDAIEAALAKHRGE